MTDPKKKDPKEKTLNIKIDGRILSIRMRDGEKGDKGDPGEPAADPSDERLKKIIKPLIPKVKDGEDPSDARLVKLIKPLIPEVKDGAPGKKGDKGDPGKDGSTITIEVLLEKLKNALPYEYLKDRPNLDTFRRMSGSGYLKDLSDVDTGIKEPTDGYLLTYNVKTHKWVAAAPSASGGGTWGTITGTLSAQTDLQAALDAKLNVGATTTSIPEGTNLYYTQARFNTAFAAKSTTDLAEGTNLYFTNARSIAATLTGYTSSAGTISATDSILQAIQKLNGNVGLLTGAIIYQGTWNASTNSPALASSVGTKGFLYKVGTAGSTTIDGISQWNVGDSIVFDGTVWDKIDGIPTEVLSVNGLVGIVPLTGTLNRLTVSASNVFDISATFEALLGKVASPLSQFAATTSAQLAGVISDETGTGALVFANAPALTNPTANTQTPGDSSTKLATTAFVAAAILGQDFKEACKLATTTALPSIVYNNGSSGVGATLTAVSFGALSLDGSALSVGDRVLVKNQVTGFQNGIYVVTAVGAIAAVFVLTRAVDFNQGNEINTGDSVFITQGTTQGTTTWAYNGIDNPTMGTTALTFAQTAGQGSFLSGNGITITGLTIAVDLSVVVDKNTPQVLTNKDLSSLTNIFPNTEILLSTTTFDAFGANGTKTTLLTSTSAKTLIITRAVVRCTAQGGTITQPASISIGADTNNIDIVSNIPITGVLSVTASGGNYFGLPIIATARGVINTNVIKSVLQVKAVGTGSPSQTLAIDLWGYYI